MSHRIRAALTGVVLVGAGFVLHHFRKTA